MYPERKVLTADQWNLLCESGDFTYVSNDEALFIDKVWKTTWVVPRKGKTYVSLEEIIDGPFKVEETPIQKGEASGTSSTA